MAGAVPSKFSPNKFGAQKFHHQPLAEASGMKKFDGAPEQFMLQASLHSTLAHLHPYTLARRMDFSP